MGSNVAIFTEPDIIRISFELRTRSVSDIAQSMGLTYNQLNLRLWRTGINALEIRQEHRLSILLPMSNNYTLAEMSAKTGFTSDSIRLFIKKGLIVSKCSYKKTVPATA